MPESKNTPDLSPEASRISKALQRLISHPKNMMALRGLCSYSPYVTQEGKSQFGFEIVNRKRGSLTEADVTVRFGPPTSIQFLSAWASDIDGLAQEIAMTVPPDHVENMIATVETNAGRFVEKDGQWFVTNYGPKGDQTVPLDSLWSDPSL